MGVDKRARARALRTSGRTYQGIADDLGISRQRAWQLVNVTPTPRSRTGGISRRLERAMETMECKTLAQAARIPYSSWERLPNCGPVTIAELDALLVKARLRDARDARYARGKEGD